MATTLGHSFIPEGPGVGNWRFAVGGFIEVVPSQVLEAAPPTIPRFTFDTRYDITENFGFIGVIQPRRLFKTSCRLEWRCSKFGTSGRS